MNLVNFKVIIIFLFRRISYKLFNIAQNSKTQERNKKISEILQKN